MRRQSDGEEEDEEEKVREGVTSQNDRHLGHIKYIFIYSNRPNENP
jgi:hypothetical protein